LHLQNFFFKSDVGFHRHGALKILGKTLPDVKPYNFNRNPLCESSKLKALTA